MLRLSPFCPVFFAPSVDRFGVKSKCMQVFSPYDRIMIEVVGAKMDMIPRLNVVNIDAGTSDTIEWHSWEINEESVLFFHVITGLEYGYYKILFDDLESEVFKVTDNASELSQTTLIQYSMKDNLQRSDCVWWIDGMQYFFDFRVQGGFKDDNWSFGVDNEQFVTSEMDILELYGSDFTQKIFTMGNAVGCPIWFAELLNRILCCSYVYFDGMRYARKESNTPEVNKSIDCVNSYVITQALQRVYMVDPVLEEYNQMNMRRVRDNEYRGIMVGDSYKPLKIKL